MGVYDNLLGDGLMEIWINQTQVCILLNMIMNERADHYSVLVNL